MTREEAVRELIAMKPHIESDMSIVGADAYDMAIEALSEPQIVRCKDCKYRIVNENYGEKGYMDLKARCELDTDDIFQLGRYAENDDWFCADGERKTE